MASGVIGACGLRFSFSILDGAAGRSLELSRVFVVL